MYNLSNAFHFLNKLSENNNREWFAENKEEYQSTFDDLAGFSDKVLAQLQQCDQIETASGRKSLYRIYRDIRFSKDKTPFKNYYGGSFRRATASLRGGYYYHIEQGSTFVAGGFWGPNKEDLLHIRRHLSADAQPLREVIESQEFKNFFGSLHGEQLKTAPKGFDKEHADIDLLRYKQFIIRHDFSDEEVLSKDFHTSLANSFIKMRPFFDCMSEMLTTDLNGVPLF